MSVSLSERYRLDDLRRLATALTSSVGVPPARASALATHLLWFDAAGASFYGISSLPSWLDRIERGEVNPLATGNVVLERSGTAVFDAQQGLPPLALEVAAGIASEKARDVGVGVVRLRNIGPTGPAAPIAASLAIGPFVAIVAGPSPSLSIALPNSEGLPLIHDSSLALEPGRSASPPEDWSRMVAPWLSIVASEDGWLILALSVLAMESLSSFHDRAERATRPETDHPSLLGPAILASRRQVARERGVVLEPSAAVALKDWAGRSNVPWPSSLGG